jgi:hypothetical protein
MTRKTWPLLLGSFVVSTVLIAACNSSTDEDEDEPIVKGGTSSTGSNRGGATQATGTLARGGAVQQSSVARGGSTSRFDTITPGSGSTTPRGGASNQGGAATTPRGGAAAAGNSNKATAGNAGSSGSNQGKAGNAGMGGAGASAGTVNKAGSAGSTSDGGTTSVAGNTAKGGTAATSAQAGSSGASNPSTGGTSTGGVSGVAGEPSFAGNAGAAGASASNTTCSDGCAGVSIPFTQAGQTAQFVATFAPVNLASTSVASISVYAPNATSADKIQLNLADSGGSQCLVAAQSLATAASGYATFNFSTSACLFSTNVIRVWVVVTSGDDSTQSLSIETIAISDTTPNLTLPFNAGSTVSTNVGACGEGFFCAVAGGAVNGALAWQSGG